jgi:peptide/nickel transport system permease protein
VTATTDAALEKVAAGAPAARAAEPTAPRIRWMRRLLRNRSVLAGAGIFLVFLLAAILADQVSTHIPTRLNPAQRLKPPGAANLLGTDEFGRDVYSLVVHGSRVSLIVGGVTMLITSLGGTLIGLVAGYYRRLDLVVMRFMDGLMAFPAILLAIAFMAARGPGVWNVILALSLVYMPRTALLVRSTVLSLRELDYVAALLVQGTFIFAYAVLAEAILGFLGVGVPPYVPSWGNVIASGKNVIREAFWVSLFPGITLTVAGLSLNLLGDGLRDTLDPRLRGSVGTGTGRQGA